MTTVQLPDDDRRVTPEEGFALILDEERTNFEERIDAFKRGYALCESPIEQQVYVQWLQCFGTFQMEETINQDPAHLHQCTGFSLYWKSPAVWMTLYPQHPIAIGGSNYRADFLIEAHTNNPFKGEKPLCSIVVELDGHDWHERTKQQATRDKRRDREFVQNGYTVLRFSGSEVFQDGMSVIRDVQGTIRRLIQK